MRYAAKRLELPDKSTSSSWVMDESKLRQSVKAEEATCGVKGNCNRFTRGLDKYVEVGKSFRASHNFHDPQ